MTEVDHPHQWFGGRSYAQHGDDLIALNIFNRIGIERPSYIDVGAYHPFDLSNTALLYQRGCRGINVEANPDLIPEFAKSRPEDVNLNLGVGVAPGVLPFYRVASAPGRSSFIRSSAESAGEVEEIEVDVTTIDDIVSSHSGGKYPDFLTVDAEGFDPSILSRVSPSVDIQPKVICVEAVVTGEDSCELDLRALLRNLGYFFYVWAGSNMFFLQEGNRGKVQ